ncbi:MAG: L-threonylcarbamoyladenylate synthase [Candidatus Eisenbacteria bacterium]|nr:L-threonylcarbamoyladenylate synthase [Candidatus Eisenbacteria bacterium]
MIKTTEGFSESELLDLVESLKRGGIVCMATDTVYGLICAAGNEEAVRKLAGIKGAGRRPFLVLIGELSWLRLLVAEVPAAAERLIARYWPGPLTIVFEAGKDVGAWLKGSRSTIAVRYPNCLPCRQLLKGLGSPVVSSSANLQGEDACLTGREACQAFLEEVDFVVDSGRAPTTLPSTIIDVTLARPTVLRRGTLNVDDGQLSEGEANQ